MSIVQNLENIKKELVAKNINSKIIAVSKTFELSHIQPLIDYGHLTYGENKVQEAKGKWGGLLETNDNIELHLIGGLQTNKSKDAVKLFKYIHSVDREKLVDTLSIAEKNLNLKRKYFLQVNTGDEEQKSGINANNLLEFYNYCKELKLNIIGLMCIPPASEDSSNFFKEMKSLKKSLNLKDLSMGMSSDYLNAIEYEATYVRVGSKIFGSRN